MVRKFMTTLFVSAAFVGLPALVGCDREVAHETKVTENSRGGTKVEEKKVVEKPDGSIETSKETKKVDR